MRRAVTLAVLALVLATPAGAQQKGKLSLPAAGIALRGAQSATPAAETPSAAEAAAATLTAAQAMSAPTAEVRAAPAQCRLACAQEYYFCLAGDGTDDCAPHWGQCRAACDAPFSLDRLASNSPG